MEGLNSLGSSHNAFVTKLKRGRMVSAVGAVPEIEIVQQPNAKRRPAPSMTHDFTYDRDELGRVRIVAVKPDYPLSNPFEKLSGSVRNEILFWPLTRAERQMVRGSRHLPLEDRRVVAHHILSLRAEKYRDHQAYLAREAKRLRDQDVIDDENRRAANWNSHLAREAEIRAEAERNRPPPPPLASGAKPETYATKDATWEKDEEDEIEM